MLSDIVCREKTDRNRGHAEAFISLVKRATSVDNTTGQREAAEIAQYLACLPGRKLLVLWARWLELDSIMLHVLIPRTLVSMPAPAGHLRIWVLEAGINYPDPSFSKYFIQAAIQHLGLCPVLERLLDYTEGLGKAELQKAASAYYWAYYSKADLSGEEPANHDGELEASLRKKLRKRLKHEAAYLRRWWEW